VLTSTTSNPSAPGQGASQGQGQNQSQSQAQGFLPGPGATTPAPPWSLRTGYAPPAQSYDELCDAAGTLRPQWQEISAGVSTLGQEEFARRWNQSQEIIRENGVTYNVYGDPEGMDRLLTFDAVPHVMTNAEWQRIEAAAVQRAHLLNLILADLYGPQNLVRHDRIPASLIMANPGFLRPCHGIQMPGNTHLHAYAADLGRAPDGNWWVFSDRTQAPSGAGYALENRQVQSQTFPDLLRQCKVRRLDTFFHTWRENLQALARPAGMGSPRFVLLTPGPYNET
jgi:uncharacterized circularly permuted ATP-grasp superfamily protein